MRITRRQFGGYAGAGLAGIVAAHLPGGHAYAQGTKRITHAIAAGDISGLDPTLAWVSSEAPIVTVVHQSLVAYPPGTVSPDFQPSLAEKWTVSPDGKLYEFSLRKGVKWHEDIGEFSADDVKFSLDRYMDASVSPWSKAYANIDAVNVVDKYTVRIALKNADPFFLASVAGDTESIGLLVSKTAFEQRGADKMRLHPIGTGPFRFKEYVARDRVVMVRFDDYWEGKPALDELIIRFIPSSASRELAMRTNEIDSMRGALDAQLLDRMEKQGFVLDKKGPETVWYLHINTSVAPLNDIRIRKAIAHAINPADLKAFLGPVSTVSDVLIPPGYFGAAKANELPADAGWGYNPDLSKKLLAEAGHSSDIKLSMIITQRDDYRQMMVLMQEHLKRVGIALELNMVDHAFYHANIVKYVNPLVLHGDLSFPNAEIFLNRFFRSDAIRNFSRTQDAEFDKFLDRIAATTTLDERRKLLVEAQAKVVPQYCVIPTTYTYQPLVRNKRVDLGYELKSSLSLEYRYGWKSHVNA